MAQKVITRLVDDIDGKEIAEGGATIQFAIDGVTYEIDLNDKNAKKMREAFDVYVQHARRTGGRAARGPSGRSRGKSDKAQLQSMRAWARQNGYNVSDRGRISQEIQAAYHKAS
ncbi:Lsr2 family protein [Intrasporangium mesophilum]